MPRGKPKGSPKTGGRKPGSLNKRRPIEELCLSAGLDPFLGLVHLGQDEDKGIRLAALKELCQYLEPKRKALEHSFDPSNDELKQIIIERMNAAKGV